MAWYDKATQRPVPSHGGAMEAYDGLIVHAQQGDGSCFGEFDNPDNEKSATWWISKSGLIEQYVDDALIAWAQMNGNRRYNSVEFEGWVTEPLTDAQIETGAQLYAYGVNKYNWPLQLAELPGQKGLGWHGMGGDAWGHPHCPGDTRKLQRMAIITRAAQLVHPTLMEVDKMINKPAVGIAFTPDANGYWMADSGGDVFSFGNAEFFGSMGGKTINAPIVNITSTPTGKGYSLTAADGGVFAFGDAKEFASTDGKHGVDCIK